jgi:UDP-GlcNAc:undecaprenyl-phosphate/decaprenyl-phosphate GlcNAc-1-phosphate transferase
MLSPVMVFGVALLGAITATELVRVIAVRLRIVDEPGGRRAHRRTTPRLGGIGIVWGFACALGTLAVITGANGPLGTEATSVGTLLAAAGLMGLTGQVDDRFNLPAMLKLVLCIVAALMLWAGGWRVEQVGVPGVFEVSLGVWSLPVTLAWSVLVINAVNLIDGLDGLAGGLGVVACLAALLAPGLSPAERMIAVSLGGALLGFLWFNLHPALIFMGDAGSLFAGVVLTALTMRAAPTTMTGAFPLVPALLLAVPLGDTTFAILRRSWAGAREADSVFAFVRSLPRRVFTADRGHVHHQLQDAGLSPRRAAAVLWAMALSFGLSAVAWTRVGFLGAVLTVGVVVTWSWMGWRFRLARRRSTITSVSHSVGPVPGHTEEPARDPVRVA